MLCSKIAHQDGVSKWNNFLKQVNDFLDTCGTCGVLQFYEISTQGTGGLKHVKPLAAKTTKKCRP